MSKWFWRIFSSVVQFLVFFQRPFEKNQNQRTMVFQKIEIKEPWERVQVFQNCQRTANSFPHFSRFCYQMGTMSDILI
jgi:hypothetical protein